MWASFRQSVALGGLAGLLLRYMGSQWLKRMRPKGLHGVPGGEFVAAREARAFATCWNRVCSVATRHVSQVAGVQAADDVGAQIVLGDRPIEITLERCWSALTWQSRCRYLAAFLGAMAFPGLIDKGADSGDARAFQERVEQIKAQDMDETLQAAFAGEPGIIAPLVHERDLYLAWSCKRSKAVNGARRVVAVVGKGHLRGMLYAMENDPHGEIRFSDLVGGRNTKAWKERKRQEVVTNLARDTAVFTGLGWLLHEYGFSWH